MVKLADSIEWNNFDDSLAEAFYCNNGIPSMAVRLIVGLHYLKYTYDLSGNGALYVWLEDPYWQYFTGGIYFGLYQQYALVSEVGSSYKRCKRLLSFL